MRPETAIEKPAEKKAAAPKIVKSETLFERIKQFYKAIEEKAYGFFEKRGHKDGFDLEDWFKAESELFSFVPFEIKETATDVVVNAELPGFKAEEIKVSVEPNRVIIICEAKREQKEETDKIIYRETGEKELFRSIDLSSEVDYEKAEAELKGDKLEIKVPKLVKETKQVEVKSAL